jgi:hypothetical protein
MSIRRASSSWVASTLKHPTLDVPTKTMPSPVSTDKRANLMLKGERAFGNRMLRMSVLLPW